MCLGRTFLIVLNLIFAIVGLGMMVAGIYGVIQFGAVSQYGVSQAALGGVAGMGALVLIFSLLGMFGAILKKKGCLIAYVIFLTLALIGQIIAGVVVMVFSNQIKAGETQCPDGALSCKIESTVVQTISKTVDCSYAACCLNAMNTTKPNTTMTWKAWCESTEDGGPVPTGEQVLCDDTLKKIEINGKKLIDCSGNLAAYRSNFFAFLTSNMAVLGGAVIGFGVVQLLAVIFACVIMHQKKEEFDATA
jgi:hypothetical protein